MMIEVKLFGPQSQLAANDTVRLHVEEGITCGSLRGRLAVAQPALAASLPASLFAVNHAYADDDRVIHVGDEVALIGMVSGG